MPTLRNIFDKCGVARSRRGKNERKEKSIPDYSGGTYTHKDIAFEFGSSISPVCLRKPNELRNCRSRVSDST